jgi:methyl-accepting chemotaxis protein
MSASPGKNSNVGGVSVFVLSTVAFLCVAMIGATGYMKYQLDRSEIALAAPDSSFTPDQEIYEKTLHALGYGGFLGSAQTFIAQHDKTVLEDMKQDLKAARDTLNRLPDKTTASVRHDVQAILAVFDATQTKAEQNVDNPAGFTNADLLSAQAALPVLDSRLQAAVATTRLRAQDEFKLWGLSLTLVAWLSLILAAAMAAGLHAALRNRQSVPLHALAQSVENLSRGDMQTPVWGMERRDAIGELARAVDLARYHFSRLPDLSLMSDQGPVRIRFEGETHSLFEAMMKNITEEYERARSETSGYTGTIASQQEILTTVATRLNALLGQVEKHSTANDLALQKLASTLANSAQSLTQTQEKGAAQIGKLVPYMQERAQNMAEVTRIAGTQMSQMLQNLMQVEQSLRGNATQSQQIIQQLAGDANQMGERLFATVNLLQASGKVLTETTEMTQSRLNEAVNTLSKGEINLRDIIARAENRLNSTANAEKTIASLATRTESSSARMDSAVTAMSERHDKLSEQIVLATHRMEAIVASFDSAQRSMGDTMQAIQRDGSALNSLIQELRANNEQLLASVGHNNQANVAAVQNLAERSNALMQKLEAQITQLAAASGARIDSMAAHGQAFAQQAQATTAALSQAVSAFSKTGALVAQSHDKLATLTDHMESVMQRLNILGQLTGTLGNVAGQLGQLVPSLSQDHGSSGAAIAAMPESLRKELHEQGYKTAEQIQSLHDQLTQTVVSQVAEPLGQLVAVLMQHSGAMSREQTAVPDALLTELQTQWGRALAEIKMMHEQMAQIVAQQVAGSLSQLTPLLTQGHAGDGSAVMALPDALLKEVQDQWYQAMIHIEAMHDQLAQMIVAQKDQLETRLIVMDKKLKASPADDQNTPQQTAIG